ncbi:sugar ABC transporter permease [Paenibacillus sp. HWE-109]|uniref:carbohydrate ABC transporter permease n=1 Tax=Paenibacillus sp. HWE-109 TaxID=1306526 RepID=UPI001EDF8C84|nr:sugar ABC transporter permease [Paenibacillus sp. HWE-109]UKS28224.1 sugar ABC transporter permease [Paenibacillus sp. HWE-109]
MFAHRAKWIGIGFVFPAMILYTVLLIYPALYAVYMSFFNWNLIASSTMEFVGFHHYVQMLEDATFWRSLTNACWFILGSFLVLMPISFALALVVTGDRKFKRFFKTAFFMPVVLPITAVGLMWTFILNPNFGALNALLETLGLGGLAHDWLGDPDRSIFTVVLVNAWVFAGLNMVIFAAGLVSIPKDIYQAAEIDGANRSQQIWQITIPMMKETFKIFSILAITGSLKVFDIVYVMTGGGPNQKTEVPASLLFNQAFKYNNFGLANSIGTFILVAGLTISLILNRLAKQDA